MNSLNQTVGDYVREHGLSPENYDESYDEYTIEAFYGTDQGDEMVVFNDGESILIHRYGGTSAINQMPLQEFLALTYEYNLEQVQ